MKTLSALSARRVLIGGLCFGLQMGICLAKDTVQEEFNRTLPLTSNGQVRLDNVNGKVHFTAWDRPEVQIHAIKRASNREDLEALKIEIDAKSDQIRIHTKYPKWKSGNWRKSNSASVDYEIKVPTKARLAEVETVNGNLEIEGLRGPIQASTTNGRLIGKGLAADAKLESVNGAAEIAFDQMEDVKSVTIQTVNGRVELRLPIKADADISAKTLNGSISADSGLTIKKNWPIGSEMHGKLGSGRTRI
ncbi:MAG TPA: hypothetical protein VEC99_06190, partial [Clostridia bacterium]|nr:hypothetical protein [Clostridia bacterium]